MAFRDNIEQICENNLPWYLRRRWGLISSNYENINQDPPLLPTLIAGMAIPSGYAIGIGTDGLGYIANDTIMVIGISATPAGIGEEFSYKQNGQIEISGVDFTVGATVYVSNASPNLSATKSTYEYEQSVGIAITATLLAIQINESIDPQSLDRTLTDSVNYLTVRNNEAKGIGKDANGLKAKLQDEGGVEFNGSGEMLIKAGRGLSLDSNGLIT